MKNHILRILFSVIIAGLASILMSPEVLMASDSVTITGLDVNKIVETVVTESIAEDLTDSISLEPVLVEPTPAQVIQVVSAPKAGEAEYVPVVPAENVKFSWGTQEFFRASSTAVNSGANVARVGKLIWGHNYTAFGNITKLGIGSTFTVTENGTATTYEVVANPLDGKAGVVLDLKDDFTLSYAGDARYSSIKMNALTDMGFGGHSLVLLTCYGSNSRYVVVADAI